MVRQQRQGQRKTIGGRRIGTRTLVRTSLCRHPTGMPRSVKNVASAVAPPTVLLKIIVRLAGVSLRTPKSCTATTPSAARVRTHTTMTREPAWRKRPRERRAEEGGGQCSPYRAWAHGGR